jgi:hypothetical protein
MSSLKLRHFVIFLVSALLLAIWAGHTQLAEFAIKSLMQGYGLKDVTAEISRLGLNKSHLSRFGFSLVTDTGLFKLEAYNLNINYDLEQLTEGRVESLAVNKLVLHSVNTGELPDSTQTIHETLEPLLIIAALRQALREYVIFNTFSVKHMALDGEPFGIVQGKAFELNGTNDAGTTYAELTLLEQGESRQDKKSRQLVINKLTEDSLQAELRFAASQDSVAAGLELNIHDTDIDGTYRIDAQPLKSWLRPFADINGIKETMKVDGTFSSSFKSDTAIVSIITAMSEKYVFRGYSMDNAVVKLKLENPTVDPFRHTRILNGSYIKSGRLEYESFSLENTRINMVGELSTSADNWQYKGGISAVQLAPGYESRTLQLKDIATRISASSGNLQANGYFSTANVPGQFTFALAHDFDNESGRLSIKTLKPIDLSTGSSKLSQLLNPWTYPFDMLAGQIELTSSAAWSQNSDSRLTTRVRLDDAGGNYGELVFSGLSFDHELDVMPEIHSVKAGKVILTHLDSGVTASNISAHLSLETAATGPLPQLVIRKLQGEIFDGAFSSDNFVFDLNRNRNSFRINATNIDLAQIVETQQLEDIVVTGRIDGTIPVEINEQGVFIRHGAFVNAVRAGSIRYNPAAGTDQLKQNPLTGIALDALKDFRYSHLSADVNFTPEGMLKINLQLKGTSPELDTKRPVHLNINTEQNLLSLLKSLRYAEGVSESIDQKVRRQYNKNQKQ